MESKVATRGQEVFTSLLNELKTRIFGQEPLLTRMLISLIADGHLLVEGVPGLAKTTAIKTLANYIEGDFHRIQFTPDLLPADITGSEIYRPQQGVFEFQKGPIFHHFILADEINRAPAKVQSALLEAMGERQVSVGRSTYTLPEVFLVMATQNPIEQEGTYPLPEAQLDRFLMYVKIDYPDSVVEQQILKQSQHQKIFQSLPSEKQVSHGAILDARRAIFKVHMSDKLEEYLIQLVIATRQPKAYSEDLARWKRFGASPRATISLDRCARAHAWLHGRDYVTPHDIHTVAHDVLRHRVILTFEAQAEGITTDHFIDQLLQRIAVP
jgi:MoxR-like ATPase